MVVTFASVNITKMWLMNIGQFYLHCELQSIAINITDIVNMSNPNNRTAEAKFSKQTSLGHDSNIVWHLFGFFKGSHFRENKLP